MGAPGCPEEIGVALAGRLVGELVEELVEDAEGAGQSRRDGRQVLGRAAQVAHGRLDVAREGPDLVADDRRGLTQEGTRAAQRRGELASERAQALQRRAELRGQRARLPERALGLRQCRREELERPAQAGLFGGQRLEVGVGRVDQRSELAVLAGELGREQLEVVDHALEVAAALGELVRDPAAVARQRLEALERLAQVLRRGLGGLDLDVLRLRLGLGLVHRYRLVLVGEGLTAGVQEHLQVGPRIGIELSEHLVGVYVLQRSGHAHATALGQVAGVGRARIESKEHVLQAGLRPQQDRGVAIDRRELGLDLHVDHGLAVLERDRADLADLDPRDVHRLALSGHHGLPGGQLRLHHVEIGADQRDPRGQVEALVRQDVGADRERPDEQEDDRHEHRRLLLDLPDHGPPPMRAAFRSGGSLRWQANFGL